MILSGPSQILRSEDQASFPGLAGLPISKINIHTRRVDEGYVRKIIRLKEGDVFRSEDIEKVRENLYALKFFKKVEIAASKDASSNGVILNLELEDGWYLLPLPLIIGGGGGINASLLLTERNVFKRAESAFLFGGGNRDGGFGSAGYQFDRFAISGGYAKRSFTEWAYADGAFNAAGRLRASGSQSSAEKLGPIQNQYDKTVEEENFQFRYPVSRRLGGSLGFSSQNIGYGGLAAGVLPFDGGIVNSVSAGLSLWLSRQSVHRSMEASHDLGAIFGFGMADLTERIQPLSRIQTQTSADLSFSESARAIGSDFDFTKLSFGVQPSVTFKDHERLSLRIKATSGLQENLPLSQKVATGRDLGMRGHYAREFRGDRGAGAALDFSYPFRRTHRGVWTGELFADAATLWDSGRSFDKQGVGFSLSYQFWRFPIPLGLTYTYSADDKDAQVNFAFGGRF